MVKTVRLYQNKESGIKAYKLLSFPMPEAYPSTRDIYVIECGDTAVSFLDPYTFYSKDVNKVVWLVRDVSGLEYDKIRAAIMDDFYQTL